MTGSNDGSRTVVVGLDAFDFRYLDRFESALPNLARLRRRGVEAPLRSTHPPWTGSAWPSMYTGTDPGHHGVFGFFTSDAYPDERTLVSRNDVRAPALWNYLSAEGTPSVVLNLPVTHPAEPMAGALVPGYLATEDDPGWPAGIRADLSAALDREYRIYSRGELSSDPEEKFRGYLDLVDLRRRAAVELLERHEWELAIVQVQKTDAVFHNFDDDDRFRAVYEAADDLVGSVLDAVEGSVNVVVCSDHGIGPVDGYQIFLNEVLREHGFVTATAGSETPSLAGEKRSLVDPSADDDAGASPRLFRLAARGLAKLGVTPGRVYGAAEAVGLDSTLLDVVPASVREAAAPSVDWRNSTAYCRRSTRLGVRVNLEGREPDGTVPPAEYEAVRTALVDLLTDLETPDGNPAFDLVARREAVYDGPHADNGPDVLTVPREMNNSLSTALYGRRFHPVSKYDHKRDGVFIGAGPGFEAAADVESLSLTDVAPMVMALLGRPVPDRMTGRVPPGLLTVPAERRAYPDVAYGRAAVDEGRSDGAVEDRLRSLGYL